MKSRIKVAINLLLCITVLIVFLLAQKSQFDAQANIYVNKPDIISGNVDSANADCININFATKEELMSIRYIDEKRALKIIEYREKYGKFAYLEDIIYVNGIGIKTFEKIKDKICID